MQPLRLIVVFVLLLITVRAAEFDAAEATNRFGVELFRQLAATQPDANFAVSPYSLSSGLALAYTGAAGATRAELGRALHFPDDNAALAAGFAALRQRLAATVQKTVDSLPQRQKYETNAQAIEWNVANRIFGQQGYAFRDEYRALLRPAFDALLQPLDFRSDAEAARRIINDWVETQTRQKIRNLIPPDGVSAITRLVLVNALYLKAPWAQRFHLSATKEQPFHVRRGNTELVPTMSARRYLGYMRSEGFIAMALDYIGYDMQFVIFLPDEGTSLDTVAAKLTPSFLRTCSELRATPALEIALYLPKFRLAGMSMALRKQLNALGVFDAFDQPRGSANFDPIAPRSATEWLMIHDVFHQTFISIDEAGTEASAVSAVASAGGAAFRKQPFEVRVDRPFLFAIQHRPSGACLVLGQVVDPR
ncbi:MAG: serpin family protein [Opitutae bacterium]|nr:serpin family protein [Opitutae bacterium]